MSNEILNNYKEEAQTQNEILRELYIYSGMLHAYKYPVRPHAIDDTLKELELKILALEQRQRVSRRKLEQLNNKIYFHSQNN